MTRILLDTSVVIALLRGAEVPSERLSTTAANDQLFLSAIVAGELAEGFALAPGARRQRARYERLAGSLERRDFGFGAAEARGRIRAHLRRAGALIGDIDELIAAHALDLDAAVATMNASHFRRVPGLAVQDWSKAA
ncbi:MAG: PIN domain-containing protein [Gemmatimonadota bacterium]|nr:PIN domain-containing protein [Gemmatimonadota bacterium]